MRASTKIALGVAAFVAAAYYGVGKVTESMIMGKTFAPLKPGRVNLVGVDAGRGYQIVVQNQIATLVQGESSFEAPTNDSSRPTDGAEVTGRRRIPIREMLQALQGDEEALSKFVMTMNDLKESSLPPIRVLWESDDLKKALDGDPELRPKLVADLGVNLDGSPLERLRFSSLENGIVIRSPVAVHVPLSGRDTVLTAHILEWYQPNFSAVVALRYSDKPNVTQSMILGFLAEESARLREDPKLREDVAGSLAARISQKRLQEFSGAPERVLQSAKVVINDEAIIDASFDEKVSTNGVRTYDIQIDLSDDGRQRLWQYSKHRVGSQLLLVVDGIAIGAPRIEHQLAGGQVTIAQLPDRTLAEDAVQIMNEPKPK